MNRTESSFDIKNNIRDRFNSLAPSREKWIRKSRYYYDAQRRYFRFLIPENATVLELGCGTGHLLAAVKPKQGAGIDISPDMIAIARQTYPELTFHVGDMETLDDLYGSFDFIILSDVIGFLMDIEETLRRIRSFCRPDTRLVISYHNFLWEPILELGEFLGLKMPEQSQNWLSLADISNLLCLADYEVVKSDTHLLLPKKIPIVSTLLNRYIAPLPGIRKLCLCYYLVARPLPEPSISPFRTSVIIPCRNERDNIESAITELPQIGVHQEIIFVDGHSTDGTPEEIKRVIEAYPEKDIRLLIQTGTGKGDAVRMGFAHATGEILMILDADLTVHPRELPKFYRAIAGGKGEFINGCRLIYPIEKDAMRFLNMLGNKFFSLVFSWLLNQRIKDTLCGTKVVSKCNYEKIAHIRSDFGNLDPFGDFDLLFGASKLNLKLLELPVFYLARTYGETQIRRFRHGWMLFRMCFHAISRFKFID